MSYRKVNLFYSIAEYYLIAITRMYFPFLTYEVKCGAAALDIADRQNTYGMTVAVRYLCDVA